MDGNKRIGLAASLVFLELNGVLLRRGTNDLYELTLEAARGRLDKVAIADRLREIASAESRGASS